MAKSKNVNLHKAKKAKNDEFYTMYEDVEKEVENYIDKLDGKIVYCNCDDWEVSNFYKYFKNNFDRLKLKKLIATCYVEGGKGKKAVYNGLTEVTGLLNGDGNFSSAECVDLLDESDIVVTNPPFSLFREFVALLEQH